MAHHGGVAGHEQRAHARFTHAPCDELRVLRSIIQDKNDRVALEHVGRAGGISPSGLRAVCNNHDDLLRALLQMYPKLGSKQYHVLRRNATKEDVPTNDQSQAGAGAIKSECMYVLDYGNDAQGTGRNIV